MGLRMIFVERFWGDSAVWFELSEEVSFVLLPLLQEAMTVIAAIVKMVR